jgi:hypothetical protein
MNVEGKIFELIKYLVNERKLESIKSSDKDV